MKRSMIDMTTTMMLLAVFAGVMLAAAGAARADERGELKDRFKQRYPALMQLKNDGKVGETAAGLVDVVKAEYANQKTGQQTISQFVAQENKDRSRLYELLAKEAGTAAEVVAKRNAARNFENAAPTHYLRPSDGRWVQKKDLKL